MGAICWQGTHQNSKNSTNCKPPDAMLTVVGSVASRFGPREVATGNGLSVGTTIAVGTAEAVSVKATTGRNGVALGRSAAGGSLAGTVVAAGVQEAKSTPIRLKLERMRSFIFLSFENI